ncbi:aspartate aminotransferase family protein [Halocola ammonii]
MKPSRFFFDRNQAQTTPFPFALDIERAEGIYLYDKSGKSYMDMISGVAVSNLGHSHPRVVEAIKNQVDKHMHTMVYGEYASESADGFARLLTDHLPQPLDCIYYVNSGTEANEAALKLAKRATGRTKIVSCLKSYHGSTHGSLSISGNETKKSAFRPLLPDVHFIEFNNLEHLDKIDERTACVVLETIQGDAGVRIPSINYLKAVRQRCNEVGALMILDEIQTGFGRTGSLFAFEQFDVVPDIFTIAKAMGGGLPIGGMVSSTELMEKLTSDPMLGHITTFGGNPVSCAAALASLQEITEKKLWENAEVKGRELAEKLKHQAFSEIRHRGLLFALDMKSTETVLKLAKLCLDDGLIGFWFLSQPSSFRLSPPLNITDEELEKAVKIIRNNLDKL